METIRATTVLAVRRAGVTAMGGDGQVTLQDMVIKRGAEKLRSLGEGKVLAGFAGGVADAITLFERFEKQLSRFPGSLKRAAVELAKEWRQDKVLRRLEAMLLVADSQTILLISGSGEVIEPDEPVMAIGSGAGYALAAARALLENTELSAEEIVRRAMKLTAELCVYTNDALTLKTIR